MNSAAGYLLPAAPTIQLSAVSQLKKTQRNREGFWSIWSSSVGTAITCSLDLQVGGGTRAVSRPAAGSSCSLRLAGLCLCCSSQHSMDQVITARPGPQSLGRGRGGLDKWVTRLLSPQVLSDLSAAQIARHWSPFFLLASKAAHSK